MRQRFLACPQQSQSCHPSLRPVVASDCISLNACPCECGQKEVHTLATMSCQVEMQPSCIISGDPPGPVREGIFFVRSNFFIAIIRFAIDHLILVVINSRTIKR
jgi:hypothetical protein